MTGQVATTSTHKVHTQYVYKHIFCTTSCVCKWHTTSPYKDMHSKRLKILLHCIFTQNIPLFCQTILQDDHLCQSETVFAFFSPSPEHLKQAPNVKSRGKFSLPGLFKRYAGQRLQFTHLTCLNSNNPSMVGLYAELWSY